jgi:uncharacterized protein (TIGR03435 family)
MKRNRQSSAKRLDQFFEPSRKLPAVDVEPALERLLDRQRDNLEGVFESLASASDSSRIEPPKKASHRLWMPAAAAALVMVILSVMLWPRNGPAVVESVEGGLYRLNQGAVEPLRVSQSIDSGETIRANGGSGGTLVLGDGSRVEMRSQSELSLENADDGIRINLKNGSIIVNAAKQRAGHLYVQTKDMTVSVVGTVFLVNAEEEGSRIAVIEGEVRVQQGAMEKKLEAGEQVATNPALESRPVSEELEWSPRASFHLAEWRQSAVALPAASAGMAQDENQEKFEVASVKPLRSDGGGRGFVPLTGCSGLPPQIDPERFALTANLYTLITYAYAKGGCLHVAALDLLSGGPGWVRSDQFEIQARLPDGFPSHTRLQVLNGDAPRLQTMLRNLLENRFKLVLRREQKEMRAFLLKVGEQKPKLISATSNDKFFRGSRTQTDVDGRAYMKLEGGRASMGDLASSLTFALLRPVLDRTGISGEFNYDFEYDPEGVVRPTAPDALKGQLGLELQDTKTLVEVWVIESVERPSEN